MNYLPAATSKDKVNKITSTANFKTGILMYIMFCLHCFQWYMKLLWNVDYKCTSHGKYSIVITYALVMLLKQGSIYDLYVDLRNARMLKWKQYDTEL